MSSVEAGISSGPSMTLSYSTSPLGTSIGFTDRSGSSVSYVYDAANRLTSAGITVNGTTAIASLSYDNASRLTSTSRQSGSSSTPVKAPEDVQDRQDVEGPRRC